MEPPNLHTASTYVNNLLLARGLLRNGTAIEFAKPSKAEGGANATMAQIINLVHDLVLRRDVSALYTCSSYIHSLKVQRESETLSTLSHNMQNLRSSAAQQSELVARLETRCVEFERQLALSVSQERAAKASLRSAESRNRVLREEMGRLKLSVTQIRSQCANDIRKRDTETKRLKKHLEGRRGREGTGGPIGVVVVTPMMTKTNGLSNNGNPSIEYNSPVQSLEKETSEFLTQLSQKLSDENDALVSLARTTLATLRSLQGLTESEEKDADFAAECDPHVTTISETSHDSLATDMDEVLEHLRGLLTNPSFVSLEEVEIREDEIVRLREGWDKMEARWREAVTMMDGWRKRMMETGDTIKLEDLRKGLDLGVEIVDTMPKHNEDMSTVEEADMSVLSGISASSEVDREEAPEQSTPEAEVKRQYPARDHGVILSAALHVLQPASGNKRHSLSPRKVASQRSVDCASSDPTDLLEAASVSSPSDFSNSTPSRKHIKWQSKEVSRARLDSEKHS